MRAGLPSCFSGQSNGKTMQNLVASTYHTKFGDRDLVVTVTWCKNVMGKGCLCVVVGEPSSEIVCRVEMKPWKFWRKHGSWKSSNIIDGRRVEVLWDLGSARFASGPEPERGYYVAVLCDDEVVLMLGDMEEEVYRKTKFRPFGRIKAVLVSRKQHIVGKECLSTMAQFGDGGRSHQVSIECCTRGDDDPALVISVDRKLAVEVNQLPWKFRGNDTIYVEGVRVQILWDVHDWLFNPGLGHALFIFKSTMPLNSLSSNHNIDCGLPSDFSFFIHAWN